MKNDSLLKNSCASSQVRQETGYFPRRFFCASRHVLLPEKAAGDEMLFRVDEQAFLLEVKFELRLRAPVLLQPLNRD